MSNDLEKRANKANNSYRKQKKALILKVPVPISITTKGLVVSPSTVDYTGLIMGGQFIAYDAKETEIKTRFPLANIHHHQLIFLERVEELGGLAFFLIHFKKVYPDMAFITPLKLIKDYWYGNERKSVPFDDFKDSWLVNPDDYLNDIEKIKSICKDER